MFNTVVQLKVVCSKNKYSKNKDSYSERILNVNTSPSKFLITSRRLKETTKKAMLECNPKKRHYSLMSSECIVIWNEIEELVDTLDTLQKQEELDDLDFKI